MNETPRQSTVDLTRDIPGWSRDHENALEIVLRSRNANLRIRGMLGRVFRYAVVNLKFREKLKADPIKVLAEHGVALKADRVNVLEDTHEVYNLVIPNLVKVEKSGDSDTTETEEKLSLVNAQLWSAGFSKGLTGAGPAKWFQDDWDWGTSDGSSVADAEIRSPGDIRDIYHIGDGTDKNADPSVDDTP